MNFKIEITQIGKGFLSSDRKIVEIDICNGRWKYWDYYIETDEKIALTINTIGEAHYIGLPVKDAYGFHDDDLYNETGEIQIADAIVRTYCTLLDYLNHRLSNVKEDVKSGTWKLLNWDENGRIFNAVLFDEPRRSSDDICEDITYTLEGEIEVKISVVE